MNRRQFVPGYRRGSFNALSTMPDPNDNESIPIALVRNHAHGSTHSRLTVTPVPDSLTPFVTILTSDSPEFNPALTTLASPDMAVSITAVLPYSVILRFTGSSLLRGFGLVFIHTDARRHAFSEEVHFRQSRSANSARDFTRSSALFDA